MTASAIRTPALVGTSQQDVAVRVGFGLGLSKLCLKLPNEYVDDLSVHR